MKRVVISGATSFIGVNLVKRLIREDVEILALARPDSPKLKKLPSSEKLRIIPAEMSQYKSLDSIIGEPCDCFIHLTWNGTRGADRMDIGMQEHNYRISMETLDAALRLNCECFVSAGSQAEYGPYNCPIDEDTPCRPNTEYGRQKLRFFNDALELCRDNGVRLLEPRFFSLYGPGDFEGTMVISTLRNMLKDLDCPLTECIQMWDFLYITDAVEGVLALIGDKTQDGACNFGSGEVKNLRYYIEEMARLTGTKSRLLYGEVKYPETGMVSIQPVVEKLKKTGWRPRVSFREGIGQVIKDISGEQQG